MKKSKAKKVNTITRSLGDNAEREEKKYEWIEDCFDLNSFKMKPISMGYLKKLAEDLLKWVDSDRDALLIKEYINAKKINMADYYRWKERCPELQRSHDYVLAVLGERREKGLISRKLEPTSVTFMMPHYCKEWKNQVEWRNNLRKEVEATKESKTIILERLDSNDLQPIAQVKPDTNKTE